MSLSPSPPLGEPSPLTVGTGKLVVNGDFTNGTTYVQLGEQNEDPTVNSGQSLGGLVPELRVMQYNDLIIQANAILSPGGDGSIALIDGYRWWGADRHAKTTVPIRRIEPASSSNQDPRSIPKQYSISCGSNGVIDDTTITFTGLAIPEPSPFCFFALSGFLVLFFRRRRTT